MVLFAPGEPLPAVGEAPQTELDVGVHEDSANSAWFHPPDRPISAPPLLDSHDGGSNFLFAFQAPVRLQAGLGGEPYDRPSSAPPFDKDPEDGLLDGIIGRPDVEVSDRELQLQRASTPPLGAIGSSRVPGQAGWSLGPKGEGLFAFQGGHPTRPSRSPMPNSPPTVREDSPESGLFGLGENRPDSRNADHYGLQPAYGTRDQGMPLVAATPDLLETMNMAAALDGDRRGTPPPTQSAHLGARLKSPQQVQTPPQHHYVRMGESPVTPLQVQMGLGSGSGDYGPALLHPGTVRAFESIDRPLSAPPALDPGVMLSAQAGYGGLLDIRCDEAYNEFFHLYQDHNPGLPPPLDPSPDLLRARAAQMPQMIQSDFATVPPPPEFGDDSGNPGHPANMQHAGLGVGSFAAATGFTDPALVAAYHAGHLPRSPSPPWECNNTASSHSAAAAALHAHQVSAAAQAQIHNLAQAQAQAMQQQRMPMMPGLAPPHGQQLLGPPGGVPSPGDPSAMHAATIAAAAAAAAQASMRHNSLLGAAGYPTGAYEAAGAPYPWQFSMPGGGAPPHSVGGPGMPHPGAGSAPGVRPGQVVQAAHLQDNQSPSRGSRAGKGEMDKRPGGIGGDMAPGSGRGQRVVANLPLPGSTATLSLAGSVNGVGGKGSRAAGSDAAGQLQEWDQQGGDRKPTRTGFKISHLEDIFASNQFLHNVHSIAKDQAGCRMLQHKLDEGNPEVTNAIFMEVLAHCVELMKDPFGNYLCQKLMDLCNARQLELILDQVCVDLVNISLNMHGARAVQKLIDAVRTTPLVGRLVHALEGAVVSLTQDPNGNHVIQRCLEVLPAETRTFIFRAVAEQIVDVASHRHGCRIVQRCIDSSTGGDRYCLEGAICTNALCLVQDAFGNYVVQYVLGLNNPQAISCVIHAIAGRLNVLSRQKFSSNVVERCLQLAAPEDRDKMLIELTDPRGLSDLLKDVYGNYVVQSALGMANDRQLTNMLGLLRPVLPSLRASGQGRRIAQKLEKRYPQLRAGGEALPAGGAAASSAPRGPAGAPWGSAGQSMSGPVPQPQHSPFRLDEALASANAVGSGTRAGGMHGSAPGILSTPGVASMPPSMHGVAVMPGLSHGGLTFGNGTDDVNNPLGGGRGGGNKQKKGRRRDDSGGKRGGPGGGKH